MSFSPSQKNNSGFSVLEILIAMTILILAISTIISVSFGNQSIIADSQTSAEALSKAQELLEKAQADARKDFDLVIATPLTTVIENGWTYSTEVTISNPIDPITGPDYFTKNVTATISWEGSNNRQQSVSLSTLVTDFNNVAPTPTP
jgi:type II secretory pathway pseudopilin PulG